MINKIYGLIGITAKAGKITFGTDSTLEALEKRKIKLVIIAKDASEKLKENFNFICNKNNIEIITYGNIEDISKAIGKQNKAVIRNKRFKFSKRNNKKNKWG